MSRTLLLIVSTMALSACATQAQMQAEAISTNTDVAVSTFNACVRTVFDSPEMEPIRANIPFDPLSATLLQLADPSRATNKQIVAVFTLHPRYTQCRTAFFNRLSATTPTVGSVLITGWTKNDEDLVALVLRKITWGEYVQRLKVAATESQRLAMAEFQRIAAGLQQSHEAELDRRQRTAAALAAYAQQQQIIAQQDRLINKLNRPRMTDCTVWRNTIDCTTW